MPDTHWMLEGKKGVEIENDNCQSKRQDYFGGKKMTKVSILGPASSKRDLKIILSVTQAIASATMLTQTNGTAVQSLVALCPTTSRKT
jgi:hypothetical protein